jgi:transposase
MKNQNEYEKRCKAIQLYDEGVDFNKILQLVQRGKFWLSKWLKRFKTAMESATFLFRLSCEAIRLLDNELKFNIL